VKPVCGCLAEFIVERGHIFIVIAIELEGR
jgi:hypothetical protein